MFRFMNSRDRRYKLVAVPVCQAMQPGIISPSAYSDAQKRATDYTQALKQHTDQALSLPKLQRALTHWKRQSIGRYTTWTGWATRPIQTAVPDQRHFRAYTRWLNKSHRLDRFLDNSITYIMLRDLGKNVTQPEVKNQIAERRQLIKDWILALAKQSDAQKTDHMATLFKLAKAHHLADTFIWMQEKITAMQNQIPPGIHYDRAMGKMIKLVTGVLFHQLDNLNPAISEQEKADKLSTALRMGYYYGFTYPFVDDLLDADGLLSETEKQSFSTLMRSTLETGQVPPKPVFSPANQPLMDFVYRELKEGFAYIQQVNDIRTHQHVYDDNFIFFEAQERDRRRTLSNPCYQLEDILNSAILKSAYSRVVPRSILGLPENQSFNEMMRLTGLFNQMNDDLTDIVSDTRADVVTPYTYYLTHKANQPEMTNPYKLYFGLIDYLANTVFGGDEKVTAILLERAIVIHKQLLSKVGEETYARIMKDLSFGAPEFEAYVQKCVRKSPNITYLDKLINKNIYDNVEQKQQKGAEFVTEVKTFAKELAGKLNVPATPLIPDTMQHHIDAANYSLAAGGKRLRPLLAKLLGVNGYGLKKDTLDLLFNAIEYMHTASLIMDDLPAEDNAATRRGKPTAHIAYPEHSAQMGALKLIANSFHNQSLLTDYDAESRLKLLEYSTRVLSEMTDGQEMDLATVDRKKDASATGRRMTKAELETLVHLKTGLAIEASLVMPALLAKASEPELARIKAFARHLGLAFQIKDDILDVEGDPDKIGKATNMDAENDTFVTILGLEQAKVEMYDHYFAALEALNQLPRDTAMLQQVLHYVVSRDH